MPRYWARDGRPIGDGRHLAGQRTDPLVKTITQDIALGRTLADIDPEGWPFSDVVAWNDPQKRTMENLFRIVNLGDVLNVVRKRLKSLSRDGYDGLGGMKL